MSTAWTPGIASAGAVSSAAIRARGCGLRSVAPHSIPSRRMSDEYSNSPRTFGTPSARAGLVPITPVARDVRRGRGSERGGHGDPASRSAASWTASTIFA